MEKVRSKLFLFAAIILIALSYSVDAFAESENKTIFSEDTRIIDDVTFVSGEIWTVESGVTLTIEPNADIVFNAESVLNNKGTISNSRGSGLLIDSDSIFNNEGLIENTGRITIEIDATLNNKGTINNDDHNGFEVKGTFNNGDIGIFSNTGTFDLDGILNNDGLIVNKSDIAIRLGAIVNNEGTVNNDVNIVNRGVFNHNGSFNGEEIIHIRSDAFLEWFNDDVLSFTDTGIIRVHDVYINKNSYEIETLSVSVYVEERYEEAINVELLETAEDAGIFEGTMFFSNTAPSQGHRLHVINNDIVTAEYSYATDPKSDFLDIAVGDEITISSPDITPSLKSQVSRGLSSEETTCPNSDHVLVKRTNEKLACVELTTAENFGWKFI